MRRYMKLPVLHPHFHVKVFYPADRSTAAGLSRLSRRALRIDRAAASPVLPVQHPVDHRRGASDAGLDRHGAGRAIAAARPALHAGVAIPYPDAFFIDQEHPVGTDLQADAAPGARIPVDLQRNHIL
jgi:hypothetical protein